MKRLFLMLVVGALVAVTLPAQERAAQQPTKTPAPAHARAKSVLPFVSDDYTKALADARTRGVPIFADVWAPW